MPRQRFRGILGICLRASILLAHHGSMYSSISGFKEVLGQELADRDSLQNGAGNGESYRSGCRSSCGWVSNGVVWP